MFLRPNPDVYLDLVCDDGKLCKYNASNHVCRNYGGVEDPGYAPCMSRISASQVHSAVTRHLMVSTRQKAKAEQ